MDKLISEVQNAIENLDFENREISRELKKNNPVIFFECFMRKGHLDYNSFFFLANLDYFEILDYEDWQNLLIRLTKKPHSPSGKLSFFIITYKYLKIDFTHFFFELNMEENRSNGILRYIYETPYFLQHDNQMDDFINEYSLDRNCLLRIRKKLIKQGAVPAEELKPETKKGTEFIPAKPPVSWTWIEHL